MKPKRGRVTPLVVILVAVSFWWADDALRADEIGGPSTTEVTPTTGDVESETATSTLDTGDNAWMLTSSALVLFMTAPGLAMFYSGLVRKKNVIGVACDEPVSAVTGGRDDFRAGKNLV